MRINADKTPPCLQPIIVNKEIHRIKLTKLVGVHLQNDL